MSKKYDWIKVEDEQPPNGVLVHTKIEDEKGIRNEYKMKRRNNLWFIEGSNMYVYYTPTHWKHENL